VKLEIYGRTGTGRVRRRNEDHLLILDSLLNDGHRAASASDTVESAQRYGAAWVAVADGVGGAPHGRAASETALRLLNEKLAAEVSQWAPGREADHLERTLRAVNEEVLGKARADPEMAGMCTTIAGVLLRAEVAFVFHAGDSRIYRLRAGALEQLTRDDAKPGMIAQFAGMTLEEAVEAGSADLVNCIGMTRFSPSASRGMPIETGDLYLTCTDGLFSMVPRDRLHQYLAESPERIDVRAERIFAAALEAGGHDNISLALIEANSEA